MRLFTLAIGSLAAVAAGAAVEAAPNCQLLDLGEVPVATDGPVMTVEALIDGRPTRMILDTGSQGTVLFRGAAARLGLNVEPLEGVELSGLGGRDAASMTRVREFKLGGLVGHDVDLVISGRAPDAAQGVLGDGVLMQDDVDFDLPEGKLRIIEARDCDADQVVYWNKVYAVAPLLGDAASGLEVDVLLNGVPMRAELDTAAPTSEVSMAAAMKTGEAPGQAFASFVFGDETIRNARLRVVPRLDSSDEVQTNVRPSGAAPPRPDMLLGADFFRSHRIYVARDQGKVYISYMGGPVFQTTAAP